MKKALAALLFAVLTAVQARAGTSIVEFHGAATLASQGLAPRPVASAPVPLSARDVLRTAGDAGLTIRFSDGSETRLGPNATFIVVEESPSLIALLLERGKAWAHVSKRPSRSFELRTATAVAAVRGTRFSVEARDDGSTRVDVEEGLVAVSGAGAAARGGTLLLGPGQSALAQGGAVAPAPAEPAASPSAAPAPASQDDGRQGSLDAPVLDRAVVEREAELQVQQDALQATLSQSAVSATSSLQTAVTQTSVAAASALPLARQSNSGPGSVNSGSGSSGSSGSGSSGSGSVVQPILQPVLGTTCTVTCVLGVCACK